MKIFLTTSPRKRGDALLYRTLLSLRRAGITEQVVIFSEPGVKEPKDNNYQIRYNDNQLGAFRNFYNAVDHMYYHEIDDYYLYLQDDLAVKSTLSQHIQQDIARKQDCTFYYLSLHYANLFQINDYTPRIRQHTEPCFWGLLCNLFSRRAMQAILESNHYDEFYNRNQNFDCYTCLAMLEQNIPMHYHSPTLIDHKGYHSTLNHKHLPQNKGFGFNH